MDCPKCGTRLSTIDSRPTPTNETKRLKECPKCGERYDTIETLNTIDRPPIDLEQVFKTLAEKAIMTGCCMSLITGGTYTSKEDAESDTIAELKRIYNESN